MVKVFSTLANSVKQHFSKYLRPEQISRFKANRRGYYALLTFTTLFVITLFAEVLFNDKPLVIRYQDSYYFPLLATYPETTFGGFFETEADYTDPFLIETINSKNGYLVWPPFPYSYDTIVKDWEGEIPAPPSLKHWLGIDELSRDILARVVYGFRLSVVFALILSGVSLIIGILAGLLQGYFGGLIDLFFQRFLEIWDSIPILYLLIIISSIIPTSFWWLLLITGAFAWMGYVGLVRAEVLKVRNYYYIKAAQALGASNLRIMIRHVLPNALVSTITFLPFNVSGAIITLATLDFLGLGLPAPSPSLGELLFQGKNNLQSPWIGITGFLVMAIMLTLLISIGEAVRDSLDPHKSIKKS